ncbi:MAG TPA: stage III sporulation protein AB [Tissierellia bacterium]|nr:stage III sporulation protein AB [Tissierellia bacterium]
MIFLKLIGGFLIIFSSAILGFNYGNRFSKRFENLCFLEQCIKILETEIVYGAYPLPDALSNVYTKGNKKVSFIFERIKSHLLGSREGDVFNSFLSVADTVKDELSFKDEDIELFLSLGRILGSSDREDQEKNFRIVLNQIKLLQEDAKMEMDKNEKMYKNLGILMGIAIVLILL